MQIIGHGMVQLDANLKTTILAVTGTIAAGTNFSVTSSGVNYTKTGDDGNLQASDEIFQAQERIMIFCNGVYQRKGTDPNTDKVVDGVFAVTGLTDWTLGAGWADGTGKAAKNTNGVGTLTPAVAINAVIGTVYKVVYQVLDVTVDGVTLTYGGVSDTTRTSDATYTAYITATTTGSLILTPSSNGSRFSIDNVSIKPLTDVTWQTQTSFRFTTIQDNGDEIIILS